MAMSDRGFASMDAAKQKEIAGKGGRAAHAQKRAHEWTPEEAKAAGRLGGLRRKCNRDGHMEKVDGRCSRCEMALE